MTLGTGGYYLVGYFYRSRVLDDLSTEDLSVTLRYQ